MDLGEPGSIEISQRCRSDEAGRPPSSTGTTSPLQAACNVNTPHMMLHVFEALYTEKNSAAAAAAAAAVAAAAAAAAAAVVVADAAVVTAAV